MGQDIRRRVLAWTALPVCVGIGSSKTLAKMANHIVKKQPAFAGVCDLASMPAAEVDALLAQIAVGEVWGVGRKIGERLRAAGIATVQALRTAPPKWLRAEFGVVMERTGDELRGISCLALEEVAPAKQQIIASRSFGQMVVTEEGLAEAISTYVARAAEKLRQQGSVCHAIHVFVMTNQFRPNDRQYSNGITIPLRDASNDTRALTTAALAGLRRLYRPGYLYKKAGVMLLELSSGAQRQGSLFDPAGAGTERSGSAMAALDALNRRFGRDTVVVGSAGTHKTWAMRSENRSPRYTTNWDELPRVRAN